MNKKILILLALIPTFLFSQSYEWDFSKGSLIEQQTGTKGVNSGGKFKYLEKGNALYFESGDEVNGYGAVTGIKSIAFWLKPYENTKLFLDNGTDKLEIVGDTISGTGLTSVYIDNVSNDTVTYGRWQLVIANFSSGVDFSTDFEIDVTGRVVIGNIYAYSTELTEANRNIVYTNFTGKYGTLHTKHFRSGDAIFVEDFRDEGADGLNKLPREWTAGTGSYKIEELETGDTVLSNLPAKTKYLECTSNGTIAFQNTLAYGTYRFSVFFTGAQQDNYFISSSKDITSCDGYYLSFQNDGTIRLYKRVSGANAGLFFTAASYFTMDVWYDVQVIRSGIGQFSVYIKGGSEFGNTWTLIDPTGGLGSNPVTDNTYTESQFNVVSSTVGDRITNFVYKN